VITPLPIEIIGGGVAGLATGIALRAYGIPVTLYEAGDYPRHRVCGEFISGLGDSTSKALGIGACIADATPHRSVTYYLRQKPLRPFAMPATAWGISRHTLDTRMARAFVAAGGMLRTQERVSNDDAPEGRVFATGRSRMGRYWVGLKMHVYNLSLVNDFEVHLGERAYVGLSRTENGAVNVCGIFHSREVDARGPDLILDYLRACGVPDVAERILAADPDPESFCVTAASLGDHRFAPPDRIRIGDACATIPPFTGNGLAMALQGAELAIGPLTDYAHASSSWAEATRLIATRQRRRFRRKLMLASLLHPFFLEKRRQSLLAGLVSRGLVPFRLFYAALH